MTVTKLSTNNNVFNVSDTLDISKPLEFLGDFKLLLVKRTHKCASFIKTAARYMGDYMALENKLNRSIKSESAGVFSWISKRREIKSLKKELGDIRCKLMSWVSSALCYFSNGAKG